jgi:PhzF family phenazine biosynthesis protein
MTQIIYQVDAFTDHPFAGNPAGVCLLAQNASEAWLQAIAREMNLSETAFLVQQGPGYHLRWFTPVKEVRLCGHATLASAHILWESGALRADQMACFQTLSGELTAERCGEWIEMNFPARPAQAEAPLDGLLDVLGVQTAREVVKSNQTYLVELVDEEQVRALQPDFFNLAKLPVRSVVVTARSATSEFDFVSRYFAPAVGINEDPVTGSAHCILTPYWAGRLGKTEMRAYQASARGGVLRVRAAGERVIMCGQAVTVMACHLVESSAPHE